MNIKKMFVLTLLGLLSFLFGNEQQNSLLVKGDSLRGHGIYVINTYAAYPSESDSSYTFWILNLDDTFEYHDLEGNLKIQSYGGMGLSLEEQEMSNVKFGFEAWGPYSDMDAAQDQVDVLVMEYQRKYPLAGVLGYLCKNAYFEANSPLSNQGWCP